MSAMLMQVLICRLKRHVEIVFQETFSINSLKRDIQLPYRLMHDLVMTLLLGASGHIVMLIEVSFASILSCEYST